MSRIDEQAIGLSLEEKRLLVARLLREKSESRRSHTSFAHRLFEEQAHRSPLAPALTAGEASLTYGELNDRANRLAARLRLLGVGPETLVGVCLGRSVEMVVALLGVLKAGGAYLPVDPTLPESRLEFMLGDARVAVLITEQDRRESLDPGNASVISVDSNWENEGDPTVGTSSTSVSADNLAYVIYTSGSTGRPKGVQVTHGALGNFLRAMKSLTAMAASDALLAVTTLSFDIAGLEIFLPLAVGARIEIVGRDVAADGPGLIERLADPAITFFQATPATWRMLLEAGWQGKPSLTLLCGGEAMPRALADRLVDKGRAVWNLYGPTETTIWSSAWRVEAGDGPVAIGRPITNTKLYVIDQWMRPSPLGVTGELFIGGAGLARGYLSRPSLTAERFVPDPFGEVSGGRLYRTGDLARWRADGQLECLGRVDHQVKVRGFRIELGEIEATLEAHADVREAAVAVFEDSTGETSLAAYVVPRDASGPIATVELRRWLLASLPEYMVPAAFVTLDLLPLTPNGKVDRKALPDPRQVRSGLGLGFVPPRGPVEEAIAGLWSEVIGIESVGAHDNFFELGGHSLLVTQLVARLGHIFGVEPSLKDFVEEPTVAKLAQLVEQALVGDSVSRAKPIVRVARDGPLTASFAQHRLWFLDQLEPGQPTYNIPTAVRLTGELDVVALEAALVEIARRHEVLRTTFAATDGIPYQVITPDPRLPFEVEDLQHLEADRLEAETLRLIETEASKPFDLAAGPLIRARLLRLDKFEHVILVTMHHVVSDGWSVGVLIREVSILFDAFRRGEPSPLAEPMLQYADYAAWQRARLQGEILRGLLDYWSLRLEGLPSLEIPSDRPRSPVLSRNGGQRTFDLPRSLLDAARELGRQEGATPFMTLLAAFQILLQRYSGQDDFAVGTPIAGRTMAEIEGLIGFFVNTLVLRADLSGDPSFRELLGRTRRSALEAYAHQELPFEQLVGELRPDRKSTRPPLFQVMFALQNAPRPDLEAQGLKLQLIESPSGTAKFDLSLFATEDSGGLTLVMEYSSELYDAATVDRMLAHFRVLLEAAVAEPDRPIGSLAMITEAERQRMLQGWDDDDDEGDLDELGDDDLDSLLGELATGEVGVDE